MPGESYTNTLPSITPEEMQVKDNLQSIVETLSTDIGSRTVDGHYEALRTAAEYLKQQFRQMGYPTTTQEFHIGDLPVENIIATNKGRQYPEQIIVIGAHYDTHENTPGANDNGSGIASLMEIARLLKDFQSKRTIRFVAFTNEEPPFFHTEQMGSAQYASACKENNDHIIGMISLETMGYFSDEPDSQHYPSHVAPLYPSKGNFIAFVSDLSSAKFLKKTVGLFRQKCHFPSEGAALPSALPGIGWSDHWSFWQNGYPAIMVTDTAVFRYPHYHMIDDTPDKLSFGHLARITIGLSDVVKALANE